MIGNDVVDLGLASRQSNWRRKGFLEKVFSSAELEVITTSTDKGTLVWLLWSMKEAAYKAHQREFSLPRRLNWLVQECKITSCISEMVSGEVSVEGKIYKTTSEITSEYIHTSAKKSSNSGVKNAVFKAPSSEAKKNFLQEISCRYEVPFGELQLEKDLLGMPVLYRKRSFFFDRFSFSGHGRFYAYSLPLINC